MGTIADKLQLLISSINDIRAAIAEKGQSVPDTAPLSSYGDKIRAIQTGADTSDATAAAGDILSGKTAYVNGGKVTGSMPSATQATPSITVSSGGLITASATQGAGYVAAGTKSATQQLTTQGAKTVTPSTSEQTAVASGRYTTGAVKVAAMSTATQATPSIDVSSGGLITASAIQAAGYVAAGTKSATRQLATLGAQVITPGTADKTIASGQYLTGVQTIKGDANLLAENIKSGVSIFGVTGTCAGEWRESGNWERQGDLLYFNEIANASKIRALIAIGVNTNTGFEVVISPFLRGVLDSSGILPELGTAAYMQGYMQGGSNFSGGDVNYFLGENQVLIDVYGYTPPNLAYANQFILLYKI